MVTELDDHGLALSRLLEEGRCEHDGRTAVTGGKAFEKNALRLVKKTAKQVVQFNGQLSLIWCFVLYARSAYFKIYHQLTWGKPLRPPRIQIQVNLCFFAGNLSYGSDQIGGWVLQLHEKIFNMKFRERLAESFESSKIGI